MNVRSFRFSGACAILSIFLVVCGVLAQSREKPKLNNFGSSLEKLKWDPERKATVETKSKPGRGTAATAEDVVRVETSLVVSDILVLDPRGQAVPGLGEKDFVITEDARTQPVGMFSPGDNAHVPRSIVLIIDYSCMELPFLQTSVAAARTLIDKLGPLDRMAVVTDDIELLVNYTNNKTRLNEGLNVLLKRSLGALRPFGEPVDNHIPIGRGFQYSALMAVLKEAFDDEDVRPIIIFQTQGSEAHILRNPIQEPPIPSGLPAALNSEMEAGRKRQQKYLQRNQREFSLNDVYKAAESSRATIYTVAPGFRLIGLSADEQVEQIRAANQQVLSLPWISKQHRKAILNLPREILRWEAEDTLSLQSALAVLSTITGGWIEFLNQPAQAEEIYSRIVSDINRRYLIGYYPTNKEHDGTRRKVNISVRDHPDYLVMGRKSYYAPGP